MKIVTVIPLAKGAFKENLTYFTAQNISDGSIVSITLRNKKILGLVASSTPASDDKMNIKGMQFNLKKIIEIKEHSIFRNEFIASVFETNTYFAGRVSDCFASLIPNIFREEYDKVAKFSTDSTIPLLKNIKAEKSLFQASFEDRISEYKTMIRGNFAEKKSVFVILPTEFDIENFSEKLTKGIENFTFVMHGGLKPKKVLENFEKIMTSAHPVLVFGTAPFLSIPRSDIGTIIVEHESSNVYKSIAKPYIDLRIFAEIFASKINAKFILSDTLLRFESIERKDTDHFGVVHPLSFRTNFNGKIEILGKGEKFQVLMDESVKKIQKAIENKKNVFIFSLRKGLATQTICRDCNQTLNCEICLAPVVLYLSRDGKKRLFSCNRCKRELSSDTHCMHCGSWNLMPMGIGTDTVYEEVSKTFPNLTKEKIFKLDKDSVKTAKEANQIIKEFEENTGGILIGTEMAFFYLKKEVTLSIIASFDSLWSIPNFKMGEKIIHILLSIISKTEKEIIIQTKNDRDPPLRAITSGNLLSFVREELEDRKQLEYPPFKRFIKITHFGDKEEAQDARQALERIFEEYKPEIFSGFVAREKGKYSTNVLMKIETQKWSVSELSLGSSIDQNLLSKLSSLPPSFKVDIDPEDLL